ncbi:MAG: hypothetical protein DRO05_00580 [Thermoproteota archaeon]|nr:MAG: hypothetical protein DRO05_00580 [Candidatus Korarchaeota archaeon]
MKLVNLTPHPITFPEADVTIPPSGMVARVEETVSSSSSFDDLSIPIATIVTGKVVNLPDPQPGVGYIVSRPVALAVIGRPDVFVPDDFIRDENGRIIGARRLARFVKEKEAER